MCVEFDESGWWLITKWKRSMMACKSSLLNFTDLKTVKFFSFASFLSNFQPFLSHHWKIEMFFFRLYVFEFNVWFLCVWISIQQLLLSTVCFWYMDYEGLVVVLQFCSLIVCSFSSMRVNCIRIYYWFFCLLLIYVQVVKGKKIRGFDV